MPRRPPPARAPRHPERREGSAFPVARERAWGAILPRAFYGRPTEVVSRELLGTVMVSRVGGVLTAGRVVETEAYLGESDPGCHAVAGRTKRTWHLFDAAGAAYIYFTYGMHWCTCAVTEREGWGSAVLIRALEPLAGIPVMYRRRGPAATHDRLLASGPARLSVALGLDGALDGAPITRGALVFRAGTPVPDADVAITGRIGFSAKNPARDWPLRWVLRDNPWTSRGA